MKYASYFKCLDDKEIFSYEKMYLKTYSEVIFLMKSIIKNMEYNLSFVKNHKICLCENYIFRF